MLRPLGKGMWIALICLLATACAPRTQYMGLDLRPGAAIASDVRALAERARSGDKQAQYELGRWFEDSTDADGLKKAIKLYQIAATPRGGSQLMFVPGPSGVTTSVVHTGPKIEGNEAALTRLRKLTLLGKVEIESKNNETKHLGIYNDQAVRKIENCIDLEYNWGVNIDEYGSSLIFGVYASDDFMIHFINYFKNKDYELNLYRIDEDSTVYFSENIKIIYKKNAHYDEYLFNSVNIKKENIKYYLKNPIIIASKDKQYCVIPKPSKSLVNQWIGNSRKPAHGGKLQ